jgi:hypothetical protein
MWTGPKMADGQFAVDRCKPEESKSAISISWI